MKHLKFFLHIILVGLSAAALASCGGAPVKSECRVEVWSPVERYSEVALLDSRGAVIDSTLSVVNDSIRFTRNDIDEMPYVAVIRLVNPADSIDMVYMPIVVEGGTVALTLGDEISLGGTDDNSAMFRFLKAKNSFTSHYANPGNDLEQLERDYSKFFADQILLNFDNVVGRYIYDTYGSQLIAEDRARVEEKNK